MASHFNEYDVFNVPPEFRPLGAWAYFGYSILFAIPLLGLILLIVFSFSDANINRRNFARSYFIGMLVALIIAAILFFTGTWKETLDAMNAGRWPSYLSFLPFYRA